MRIADNDEIISVGKIPVSLWMIDDMDDSTTDDDPKTVMRICTQGRDLQGGGNVKYESTSHPVLLILKSDRGSPHTLNLSIYGTPDGLSDEDIIVEERKAGFTHANIEDVQVFGCYTEVLPVLTSSSHAKTNPDRPKKTVGKTDCYVYVYIKMDMASVQIFAVYCCDGGKISNLARTPFDEVFEDGKLREDWQKCRGQAIQFVQLRQAARRRPPPTISPLPESENDLNAKFKRKRRRGTSPAIGGKHRERETQPQRHPSLDL
jgi:hypothetical protein